MKIFLVINSFGAGGAERSTVELGKYLRSQSIAFYFIALRRRKIGVEQELEDEGFKVFYCPSKRFVPRIVFLIRLIKQHQPDIVHSVLYDANLVTRFCQRLTKKVRYVNSLVNTAYSAERQRDKQLPKFKFRLVKYLDIISARMSKPYFHAITTEVLKHYKPLFNIPEERSFVIYRGRYENTFRKKNSQAPSLITGGNASLKLINTGRQEFQKGQILILKAIAHLKTLKGVENIHLNILGRAGNRTAELERYITENHLHEQVSLQGFRNDVDEQLAASDVFIFPSYFEGLGGALIEAFAAGLPCICSDLPVLREVVGDERGALFFQPGDYQGLAAQIEKLYYSSELRNELSEYALNRFYQKFRIEDISARMVTMYQTIASQ
jgi:glycosyltransferase involved in cell wall biosynthesis